MALAPSRYELLNRIAVGGMAEVFRAKAFGAHGFEKTLAIKRILPELANDPEFEERFIAEAKLAVKLSHANIVQVLDFGRFAGTLFIAMELVSGLDLAALLKFYSDKSERVPIPAAFQISMEIVRGLSFAHQNGVVHRDVSPSNILLSQAGEVKIADFGIAVAMKTELGSDEGRIMGKWRYMSPEQTRGKKLGESSDLFSAAVVIHEIFSGQKLFPGTEANDITANIHNMPIPLLAELRPGVPALLDEVLAKALVRDPEARQCSGGDMLRTLTEASYKSSIVATSIDVADAVAAAEAAGVSGPGVKPRPGMNSLIREQLADGNFFQPSERNTALVSEAATEESQASSAKIALASTEVQPALGEGGTMIRSGVDGRGLNVWELDNETVAAVPSAIHKLSYGEQNQAGNKGRYHDEGSASPGLRRGVIYSAIAFSSLVVMMIFLIAIGPRGKRTPALVSVDAALAPTEIEQILTVDSVPSGATVFINGQRLSVPSPVRVPLKVGVPFEVRLALDGYEEAIGSQTLEAGSDLTFRPTLVPFKASLNVDSTPKGATIILDGQEIGVTPYRNTGLRPGVGRLLQLVLAEHTGFSQEIDLVRDQVTTIEQVLRSTVVYGTVNIRMGNTWAEVSENGKKLGSTFKPIRLRVGEHSLRLFNPESGKKMTVKVVVKADKPKTYRFDFE